MNSSSTPESPVIMIVDDNKTSRHKFTLAVEAQGFTTAVFSNGPDALAHLQQHQVDLILLDIVMPDMDGFEVLQRIKSEPETKHIPVLVISALDDDTDNVVKAIKLGAEDFLPKQSPPALLRARINASIAKKQQHDAEQLYIAHVQKLAVAAQVLESGRYNPDYLELDKPLARNDALGGLARVFTGMAKEIYQRERRLSQQTRTLNAVLLLIASGAVQGLGVPLSRMISEMSSHPIGLTVWVLFFTGLLGTGYAAIRKCLPPLTRSTIGFFVFWGLITASAQVVMFWVAEQLQASLLSIVLVTEGFIVFAIAASMKIETPTAKRLLGLLAGFIGVGMIITVNEQIGSVNSWLWVLLALLIPAIYAVEDLTISAKLPAEWDIIGAIGIVSLVSVLLLLPLAYLLGDLVTLSIHPGKLEWLLVLLTFETLIGTALMVYLLRIAGAVFGSQVGYIATFAGIAWSIALLGETLSPLAWAALGVMVVGLFLVEPTHEAEERPDIDLSRYNAN